MLRWLASFARAPVVESALIDALPISVAMRDTECRFVQVNRTWERYFGIRREDAIGRRFCELPGWQANPELVRVAAESEKLDREMFARGPDAAPVVFEDRRLGRSYLLGRQLFVGADGRVVGILATGIDISDMQDKLRDQVALTEAIVKQMPNAVFTKDADGRFTMVNRGWSEMSGVAERDAIGKTVHDIYPPEVAKRFAEEDSRLLALGASAKPLEAVHQGPRPGQYRIVRKTVLTREDGTVQGLISSSTDISEMKRIEAELADRARFVAELVDALPISVAVRDTEGRYVLVNRSWESHFGVRREEALGKRRRELPGAEADAAEIERTDRELLARGPGSPLDTEEVVRVGRYFQMTRRVLADAAGRTTGVLSAGVDLTERRAMEEALAAERHRLALVVNATQAGIVDWDVATETPWYSARFKEMLGYPADADASALPSVFGGLLHPEDRDRSREVFFSGLVDRGEPGSVVVQPALELRLRRADGGWLWVESMGLTLRDEAGEAKRYLAAITDISERRVEQERLARERERFALLVRATKAGFMDWDARTDTRVYSERFKEMLGHAPDADTSAWPSLFDIMHPEDREPMRETLRRMLGRGQGEQLHGPVEYRLRRTDGSYLWVRVEAIAQHGADGRTERFLASFIDITHLREINEALKESVRLREEVERMSRHDLKTPLNSVIAVSRLLREGGKLAREDEELLSIVERAGYRILSMVNLSLDLYRMEQGSYQFQAQAIDLMDVARKVAADLEGHAASKDVALRLRQSGHSLARAEELLCYSMLANLVKNAIEAVPAGGVVSVTVEGAGESVSVHVHNQGVVPAAIRARFFDKYASSGKSAGLGLGTYSARLMARVQEGDITLHTDEAAGTTVSVRLTAARQPTSVKPAAAATGTRAERLPQLPPQRVLVVDDDEFNRLVLRRYLPSPPLTVTMSVNGRAALDAAREEWPDVVLLDLEMPVMDGYEAAGKLREMERAGRRPVKIIAISSNDDEAIVQRALAAGCDHYLIKPAPRELLFRLLAGEAVAPQPPSPPVDGPAPRRLELEPRLRDKMADFVASRRRLLGEAAEAIAAADRERLRRCAHRLAGSFALFGFDWASARCRSVENDAARGELAPLGSRLTEVRAHLDTVDIGYRHES